MKRLTLTVSALAIGLGGSAFAQEAEQSPSEAIELERLVVTTPLRRESSLERSTSSVTVIPAEQIERSPAADLPSLLRTFAGITVTSNGGLGSSGGISLRGAKPAQTLILINGVNTRSATSGSTTLFTVPLQSIERIEIARGAHSSQYGSDAIGGVINIITKSGSPCVNGNNVCTTVTAGVSHPWGGHVGADVQGQTEDGLNFVFGGLVRGTRGYDFTTWPVELDDDGFLQGSGHFSLSKAFDWGDLYANGVFSRARTQYDSRNFLGVPSGANESDSTVFAGKVGTRLIHTDDWESTIEFISGIDHSKAFGRGEESRFDTNRYGFFAATEKSFATGNLQHVLNGGVEVYRENVGPKDSYEVNGRTLAAVFAQHQLAFDALTVDLGIRHDHNDQFGGATTYNVGASYEFVPGLVGRASYATGFRAPTFNDLYWPFDGNPDLKPETSRSYEVGLRWQATEATVFDVAFYQRWVRDQIAWAPIDPTDPFSFWQPANFERVKVTGFEASIDHRFNERWFARGTIDIRDPRDSISGNYLPGQDRFKASAEVTFSATDKLDLGARVSFAASRFSDAANLVKLPDYTILDLSANYAFDEASALKVSIENVFDEDYATVNNYRAPGRTVNVSFSRTF
ncbi:TonB-dependent receptor [Mesorhizobium sp. CAU 1732]|uniref:TonB-dependent receptor domain-containing protein n=1 Tax=Mesorhizobium sp. CAU 1732 TaxID=3140358 RepID=UPI003260EA21